MPVNRTLWGEPFREHRGPNWHCPVCEGGYLKLMRSSLHSAPTAESRRQAEHEAWEPHWDTLRFVAMFVCDNDACNEPVSCSGDAERVLVRTSGHRDDAYEMLFFPLHMKPSPALIRLASSYPAEVTTELELAFVSSWSDASAAGNHIRAAVERLLDHLREPKTQAQSGKRSRKSLHSRIVGLARRDQQLSDSLLAVKWIGNAGSHTDDLSNEEIFDALDILEIVLEDLFTRNRSRVTQLVSRVNKTRGPIRRSV